MEFYNNEAAYTIARIFLGILFLFQGFDKVFNVKISGVTAAMAEPYANKKQFPITFLYVVAFLTSYIELIGGFLLLIGLFTPYVLYILGADLILVAIGLGIIQPMWDLKNVFPRLALLFFLLLMPQEWNIISIDALLK